MLINISLISDTIRWLLLIKRFSCIVDIFITLFIIRSWLVYFVGIFFWKLWLLNFVEVVVFNLLIVVIWLRRSVKYWGRLIVRWLLIGLRYLFYLFLFFWYRLIGVIEKVVFFNSFILWLKLEKVRSWLLSFLLIIIDWILLVIIQPQVFSIEMLIKLLFIILLKLTLLPFNLLLLRPIIFQKLTSMINRINNKILAFLIDVLNLW